MTVDFMQTTQHNNNCILVMPMEVGVSWGNSVSEQDIFQNQGREVQVLGENEQTMTWIERVYIILNHNRTKEY